MTAPTRTRMLKFGVFEVNLETGELRKSGMRQKLAGQPFQVLQLLLEHPQEIVSREEMHRRIWPQDTYVDYDLGLRRAITRLREVLGDSAESPRFIETIPRRGYRFIAPLNTNGVVPGVAELPAQRASSVSTSPRRGVLTAVVVGIGAAVALLALLGFAFSELKWRKSVVPDALPIRSLAVLPLRNLSPDPNQEYFSDGLTDELITQLAQIDSIRVISHTSTMQYKDAKKPLSEIAHELKVDGIVEGTVQRSGDKVRITAQLVHGPSDKHLWANSYERDVSDVFMLERDVAGDIAREVQVRVSTEKHVQSAQPRPVNPEALEAYLRGNFHMHRFSRGFGDEELRLASEYFSQAIEAEPGFAAAYVGMSRARDGTFRSSSEDVDIARKAAQRAVELDPNFSDAWTALADVKCDFWDWSEAEQAYRRALALNPNDGDAHEHLGWLLDALGRPDEGWREAEIAQQLDPHGDHLEPALDNRREYDQIIQHITAMLEADPNNGHLHHHLFEGYAGKGMHKEAVEQLEQTLVLFGLQKSAAKLRQAFDSSGFQGAMREWAKELEYLHASNQVFLPINLASAYTAAGDKDRAFYWLEQAYSRRGHGNGGLSMVFLNRDPSLEPLRSDPRYMDLLRRVGLPP